MSKQGRYLITKGASGLVAALLVISAWGCEEARFQVPKQKRADSHLYKTRMLAAPVARLPTPQRKHPPSPRVSIPKQLRLRSSFGHHGSITGLAVAPSGHYALTGGDRELIRWRLPKGTKLQHTHQLSGVVQRISFDPTGLRYALLEGSHTISLWSSKGKLLLRKRMQETLTELRFAPISNQLLALSHKGMLVRLHGTTLQRQRAQQVCPQGQQASAIDVDLLQQWIAVGCRSGHVWLGREGETGRRYDAKSPVEAIAMSPKQPWLAIGTQDARIHLWQVDLKRAQVTHQQSRLAHIRSVTRLAFSADGSQLLSGSRDRHVGIWKIKGPQSKQLTLALHKRLPHTGAISGLLWHPTRATRIVTTDESGTLRTWQASGNRLLVRGPAPLRGGMVSFSPRADILATQADKGFAVWDLTSGKRTTASTVHPHSLLALSFASDGNHMLAVDRDNAVFWDLHHRRYVDVIYPPKGSEISAASLGREWTEIWFGTPQHGVFLWTIAGKRLLYRHTTPQYVTAVAYHPNTRRAAAATLHGKLYLYDMNARRLLHTRQASPGPITQLTFSPDGQALLGLSQRRALRWSWQPFQETGATTHRARLTAAQFAPNGKRALIGSEDQGLWWWKPGSPLQRAPFPGCSSSVLGLDFSLKRPLLAIACQGAKVHLVHRIRNVRIATQIPLSGTEWLSHNPQLDIVASALALRQFVLVSPGQTYPLSAFQNHFIAPQRLQAYLQQAIR